MRSVRGQWRRGFTRTIKTDAGFYLLNGREAERVALDRRRRTLLARNEGPPSHEARPHWQEPQEGGTWGGFV